jgi:tetratricopeptide (TPR) repeat protein
MYRSSWFLTAALMGITITLVQPVAVAKSASEVEAITRAVTVEIRLQQNGGVGSGTIIDRKGDLYTLVTNKHVVCGGQPCSELPLVESYNLGLADGQQYRVKASTIKLLGNDLDLAIIRFRSNRNYAVAKVAAPGNLKTEDEVYTAGFPFAQPGFTLGRGNAIAVVNKRLEGDSGGYTIIYDAFTLPGMSGGGVFNSSGQLVAIHGRGDKYTNKENILANNNPHNFQVNTKIGYNRGIPVQRATEELSFLGIAIGKTDDSAINIYQSTSSKADNKFIVGFNKFVDPGDDVLLGKRQAIQEFSDVLRINSKYVHAYFMRGFVYHQLRDFKQAIADYDQVININPKFPSIYNNRGAAKYKIDDFAGAVADYDQAIAFEPDDSRTYNNRGLAKFRGNNFAGAITDYYQAIKLDPNNTQGRHDQIYGNLGDVKSEMGNFTEAIVDYNRAIKLDINNDTNYLGRGFAKYSQNDFVGAITDYDRAIKLNSNRGEVYANRSRAKYKIKDRLGAIKDIKQAAQLFRRQGNNSYLELALEDLKKLEAAD